MALGVFNANGLFYSTFNPAQLNARSFADTILRLFPNGSAPLYALTGEVNKTKAKASEHGYFTKHFAFPKPKINGAKIAGDTTITLDSNVGLVKGMVLQVPSSRENIRVLTVDAGGANITVQRAFGRIAAAGINDDEDLVLVGNAHTQASTRPTERSVKPAYVPNYTQILRNAWALSRTAAKSYAEAGYNNVAENKMDCMNFHAMDFEQALIWGQPKAPFTDPTDNKLIHATQGIVDAIYQYAPDNVKTAAATTTYTQLVDLVEPCFNYSTSKDGMGRKERVAFCDRKALKVLHDIGRLSGDITIEQKETSFGMQFTEFRIYKGSFRLMEHPLLTEVNPDAGMMLIVDLPTVKVAYMDGSDVLEESYKGSSDSTGSAIDAEGGSLLSEFATEFQSPPTCGIVNGLTAAA